MERDEVIFTLLEIVLILVYTLLFLFVMGSLVLGIPLLFKFGWNFTMADFGLPILTYGKAFVLFWMWILLIRPVLVCKPER